MVTREYKCGCKITSEKNYPSIEYCSKHKAALDMYEALKRVAKLLQAQQDILFGTKWEKDFEELAFVKEALAKAGGE